RALGRQPALTAAIDLAVALQLADQRLERDAVGALDLEGAGDLAAAHRRRAVADEVEDLLAAGQGRLPLAALGHGAAAQADGVLTSTSLKAKSWGLGLFTYCSTPIGR